MLKSLSRSSIWGCRSGWTAIQDGLHVVSFWNQDFYPTGKHTFDVEWHQKLNSSGRIAALFVVSFCIVKLCPWPIWVWTQPADNPRVGNQLVAEHVQWPVRGSPRLHGDGSASFWCGSWWPRFTTWQTWFAQYVLRTEPSSFCHPVFYIIRFELLFEKHTIWLFLE